MNIEASRIAALLRELADEVERAVGAPPKSRPAPRRTRTRPDTVVSQIVSAQADRVLRERGYR